MLDAPDTDILQGLRDRAILHVYFYTGGRCSEPGTLRVRDFRQDVITPHSARATFITQAYEAGLHGEDIQRTVGHASITTIEGYNRTAKRHRKSVSFGMLY